MRANELVKKFGIEKAKLLLSTQGKTITNLKSEYTAKQLKEYQGYIVSGDLMSFVELKRLVESHELVEKLGSVSQAKFWVDMMDGSDSMQKRIDRVKQAIADVESCQ